MSDFKSALDFYINKTSNNLYDIVTFNGPALWALAPSYTLAAVDEYFKFSHINSLSIDLNFLLYLYFFDFQKKWTRLDNELQTQIFDTIITSEVWLPFWNQLKINNPSYIGLSLTSSNEKFLFKLIKYLKNILPKTSIVLGGPQVFFYEKNNFSDFSKDLIEHIDFFISGEIEDYEILYKNKKITFYKNIVPNKKIELPHFKDFPLDLYKRKNHLPLMLTRGCINSCTFCSERLLFHNFKKSNIPQFINKIKFYKDSYKVTWFTFYDSLINADKNFLYELCKNIISNDLKIKWEAQCLIKNDTLDFFNLLKQSGCFNLFIGMESASDIILKKMNKNFTSNEIKNFFVKLNQAKLHFEISLIVGFPGEDDALFNETLLFIEKNSDLIPKIAQINPFIFYPETQILFDNPDFSKYQTYYPEKILNERISRLVDVFQKKSIPYTSSYINNLLYGF